MLFSLMWLLDRSNKEKENHFPLGFTDLRTSPQHLRSPPRVWAPPPWCAPARHTAHRMALPFHSLNMERIPVWSCPAGLELVHISRNEVGSHRHGVCARWVSVTVLHASRVGFLGGIYFRSDCQRGTVWTVSEAEAQGTGAASQGHTTYVTGLDSSPGRSIPWAPGAQYPCALRWLPLVHLVWEQSPVISGHQKVVPQQLESSLFPVSYVNKNISHFPSGVCACSMPCAPVRSTVKWKMRLMFQIVRFPNYALIIHIKQVKWPLTET